MIALLFAVLLSVPAHAGERVDLLKLTNYGYLNSFDGKSVEFEATYAGPLQRPLVPVPIKLQEKHVTAALLPPRWSEHPMRGAGLVEPLTAFVPEDESDPVFTIRAGSQVLVRGVFEVVTGTSVRGGTGLPEAHPLIVVRELVLIDALRGLESNPVTGPPLPGPEEPAAIVRRRARLEAVRGSVQKSTPSDLTAEERIRRRELLIALRDRLDSSALTDPALRRAATEDALASAAFPPLQANEEP
jgi:hypothetical protein